MALEGQSACGSLSGCGSEVNESGVDLNQCSESEIQVRALRPPKNRKKRNRGNRKPNDNNLGIAGMNRERAPHSSPNKKLNFNAFALSSIQIAQCNIEGKSPNPVSNPHILVGLRRICEDRHPSTQKPQNLTNSDSLPKNEKSLKKDKFGATERKKRRSGGLRGQRNNRIDGLDQVANQVHHSRPVAITQLRNRSQTRRRGKRRFQGPPGGIKKFGFKDKVKN